MSENTLSSYTNGVRRFESFRYNHGLPKSWPPATEHIALFLSALSLHLILLVNTKVLFLVNANCLAALTQQIVT